MHVLEVEASVIDRAGKPVDTLTEQDFDVTIDGKPASLTNFFLVRRGAVVEEPGTASPSPAPAVAPPLIPTRLVLFVDDLHLHQRTKKRAIESLEKYVEATMDANTKAMLVRWNGSLNILVRPTADREELLRALRPMAKETSKGRVIDSERKTLLELREVLEPDQIRNQFLHFAESQSRDTTQTIEALRAVTRALSGLEGRKILLFVSEGLPLLAGYEILAFLGPGIPLDALGYDQTRKFREYAAFAQDSGVAFCPFNPSGPDGARYAVDLPEGNPNPDLIRENTMNTATLIARQTGGQIIADTNQLNDALALLTDQMTTYYSLGVRAPPSTKPPYDVKVKLRNKPGLRVITAARRNVQPREEAVKESVRARLYFREEENPLDARLSIGAPRKQGERCVAPMQVAVSTTKLTLLPVDDAVRGDLAVHFAVIDDRQQESEVRSTSKEIWPRRGAVVTETVSIGLQPRKYLVSVAIADNLSGETSYLQQELDATACR